MQKRIVSSNFSIISAPIRTTPRNAAKKEWFVIRLKSILSLIRLAYRRCRPALSGFGAARTAGWLAAVCVLLIALRGPPAYAAGQTTIEIISKSGRHPFAVELATNGVERAVGLMFRKELPKGRGMLFDFQQEQAVAFWMRNTYIPLDMIFIRSDGRILRIAENTEPLSERIISSGGPVRAVLEVVAGTAKKYGITAGDRVASPILRR